mmetsp:Transcript_117277/g.203748  ORF Transcript_117277/g.203748 Transcript_117277/m.203748 type:complete len:209 (-) Transcript_117277:1781-2407(-)
MLKIMMRGPESGDLFSTSNHPLHSSQASPHCPTSSQNEAGLHPGCRAKQESMNLIHALSTSRVLKREPVLPVKSLSFVPSLLPTGPYAEHKLESLCRFKQCDHRLQKSLLLAARELVHRLELQFQIQAANPTSRSVAQSTRATLQQPQPAVERAVQQHLGVAPNDAVEQDLRATSPQDSEPGLKNLYSATPAIGIHDCRPCLQNASCL